MSDGVKEVWGLATILLLVCASGVTCNYHKTKYLEECVKSHSPAECREP